MIGDRDEGVVVLAAPLVHQEVVISAAAGARIGTAGTRTRLVDRAAAKLGVEELADAAVMRITLTAHQILMAVPFARESLLRRAVTEVKVGREPLDVALIESNDGI